MTFSTRYADNYELALGEARRGITQQSADLDMIRRQTTAIFGIAVGAVLLAAAGWQNDQPPGWYIRVAIFTVDIIMGLWAYTCWPRTFVFTNDETVIIGEAEKFPGDLTAAQQNRDVALWMGAHYKANRAKLKQLLGAYRLSLLLLIFEVIWLLARLP